MVFAEHPIAQFDSKNEAHLLHFIEYTVQQNDIAGCVMKLSQCHSIELVRHN